MRHLAIDRPIVNLAIDRDRHAIDARREASQSPPAVQRIGCALPELRDFALGREHDAREPIGRFIQPLKSHEAIGLVGDDLFAIAALANVVQAQKQHLRLNPVQHVHHRRELEDHQRARIGQQEQLGMLDDLRRLALANDLNAMRRPEARVQLNRVQAPDRAGGGGERLGTALTIGHRILQQKQRIFIIGQVTIEHRDQWPGALFKQNSRSRDRLFGVDFDYEPFNSCSSSRHSWSNSRRRGRPGHTGRRRVVVRRGWRHCRFRCHSCYGWPSASRYR